MFDELLVGFMRWIESSEKVKMRSLDLQERGLKVQEENSVLTRQHQIIQIAMSKIDLDNRARMAMPIAPSGAAPQPLAVVPEVEDEGSEGVEKTLEDMNLDDLKAVAKEEGVKFKSNITEGTLRKKITNNRKNEAAKASVKDGEVVDSNPLGVNPPAPVEEEDDFGDETTADPSKDFTGAQVRKYCRAHMSTQKPVDNDKGRAATIKFLEGLTGFGKVKDIEAQENSQELFNIVACACIDLGLSIPEEEEL